MADVVVGVLERTLPEAARELFTAAGISVHDGLQEIPDDVQIDVLVGSPTAVDSLLETEEQSLPIVLGLEDGEYSSGALDGAVEYFYWTDLESAPRVVANRLSHVADRTAKRTGSQLVDAIRLFGDLEQVFSDSELETDERLRQLVTIAADRMGYPIAFLTRIEAGTQEIVAAVGDHELLQPGETGELDTSYCQHTVERNGAVVLPDVPATDVVDERAFEKYGLSCYVGAPIYVDGEIYGTFCFADTVPRREIVVDVHSAVVSALADRIGFELSQPISQLRMVFDSAPDPIIIYTSSGDIIDVNNRAVEELGYDHAELTDMNIADIEVEIESSPEETRWTTPPEDGPIVIRGTHERKDGSTHPVEVWITNVTIAEEDRFVAIARDITEQVEHEKRLETQRNSLELLNEVMRHDIRNDLQLVLAYANELSDHVGPEGEDALQIIKDAAHDSVELTETGRDLAQVILETQKEPQEIELAPIIEDGLDAIRKKDPELTVAVEGSLPEVTVVGTQMLETVFRNLFKNAIQHNDKATPEITVSGTVDAETVTIRVADNGPGIPDAQKESVFGHGEHGLGSEGSGIGLYLVKTLVTDYGGEVWIEDNDPTGAVFVVELPLAGEDQ